MLYFEIMRVAINSLRSNPMRSMLTMLGVIIGVAAVITMVALGTGAQAAVEAQLSSLGADILTVSQGFGRGASGARGRSERLSVDDAIAIQAKGHTITDVVPVSQRDAQVEYGNVNLSTRVIGTWANWAEVNRWEIGQGRFMTKAEADGRRRVAVLGSALSELLFPPSIDPVGSQIRIRGIQFEVIGVFEEKGSGNDFRNPDEQVWIPLSTSQWRVFGTNRINNIQVQIASENLMMAAMAEIESVVRRQHRLRPDVDSDFRISSQTQFLEVIQESRRTFTMLLAGIAAVSLVVGGIGIMNIMLVSVTERTREIGIRKAIGATRGSVQLQFLIEAVVLSCLGGALGIALAWVASQQLSENFGWTMVIPPNAVVMSFGFSAMIGIVFGFYPAVRASRLDPIEALRYE
ncbi:MAG: ABC transporter permease [Acidobacteria bacterium]|nr:ABC transporter permease [Acidobacteriota bacterium]